VVNLLQNGNKTADINVKNFHRSLTTEIKNDTSKTANISFNRKKGIWGYYSNRHFDDLLLSSFSIENCIS